MILRAKNNKDIKQNRGIDAEKEILKEGEGFHSITPCVLVQVDYKGDYERFALTPAEFEERYRKVRQDMPKPTESDTEYTFRPLVHIWYMLTTVGSVEWCNFFTDMTWGLTQSDIDEGNVAFVKEEDFGELKSIWVEFDNGL